MVTDRVHGGEIEGVREGEGRSGSGRREISGEREREGREGGERGEISGGREREGS